MPGTGRASKENEAYLTAGYARLRLDYNETTGLATWKPAARRWYPSKQGWKIFTTRCVGKPAGTYLDGYLQIRINGRAYQLHRVIFLMMTGRWPREQIDHVDHNGVNNAWTNIREATNSQNQRNRKLSKRNKTGRIGVHLQPNGLYYAAIGKTNLGRNLTFKEACARRNKAEREQGYAPNHGRYLPKRTTVARSSEG